MKSISVNSFFGPSFIGAVFCVGLLSACARLPQSGSAETAKAVPAALQPADNERVAFIWHAIGSQIYECRADKGTLAWVFVAPEAYLYNQKDEKVGTHGAGPHWTASDGSKTVGTVKARVNGERSADIPLLLLSAKSSGIAGKMAAVTSVQRLNTEGGNAPTKGCVTQFDAGKLIAEGYTADYVFFMAK